jgi:hypothetical protein
MKVTAKQFKQGHIYKKNGHTIYYGQGRYYFIAFNDSHTFSTLKEVKEHIKNL